MNITILDKTLKKVFRQLSNWSETGINKDVTKASEEAAKDIQNKIRGGKDGSGKKMTPIKDKTLDMPIRYSSDRRLRKEVNSSKDPLVATGRMVSSIKSKRMPRNEWEIGPTTTHGKNVIDYNATKASIKRDPLVVGNDQVKLIEDALVKALEREIRR